MCRSRKRPMMQLNLKICMVLISCNKFKNLEWFNYSDQYFKCVLQPHIWYKMAHKFSFFVLEKCCMSKLFVAVWHFKLKDANYRFFFHILSWLNVFMTGCEDIFSIMKNVKFNILHNICITDIYLSWEFWTQSFI